MLLASCQPNDTSVGRAYHYSCLLKTDSYCDPIRTLNLQRLIQYATYAAQLVRCLPRLFSNNAALHITQGQGPMFGLLYLSQELKWWKYLSKLHKILSMASKLGTVPTDNWSLHPSNGMVLIQIIYLQQASHWSWQCSNCQLALASNQVLRACG